MDDQDLNAVALHPELTQDPRELRWVISTCPRDLHHAATHPDGPLSGLVRDGLLSDIDGGPGWITTSVADPGTWRDVVGEVRRAVRATAAAVQAEGVLPVGSGSGGGEVRCPIPDDELALLAASLLQEHIAPIAGAHGGRISIRKVTGGVVTVDLVGACHGCPAAVFTLKQRFEAVLQRTAPGARVIEA